MARWKRRLRAAFVFGSSIVLPLFSAGCTNPEGDYNDFRERNARARGDADFQANPDVNFDGSFFADGGAESYSGTFWGACLDITAGGDATRALYLVLKLVFTGNPDGTALVSGTSQSLVLNATKDNQTVGAVTPVAPTSVAANGTFTIKLGDIVIDKNASTIGLDVTIRGVDYVGRLLSRDTACADFHGMVVAPIRIDLTGPGNKCVFFRSGSDGAVRRVAASEFHCP